MRSLLFIFVLLAFATTACKDKKKPLSTEAPAAEAPATAAAPQVIDFAKLGVDSSQVKKTPSGLMYVIKKEGQGNTPRNGEYVTAHYTGTLLNGTKFDSSRDRGKPFSFQIGMSQVIKGWDEGFLLLKPGAQALLIIPSELGYGSQDMGNIPPNSTLVFDVELIGSSPSQPTQF
jgi:peptidylprolyl isomerase